MGRLELVAAVMSVMLAVKICIALELPLDQVLFFTRLNGGAVLADHHRPACLHMLDTGWLKYVRRTHWKQWKYIYTAENPSDLPTRGMRAEDSAKG